MIVNITFSIFFRGSKMDQQSAQRRRNEAIMLYNRITQNERNKTNKKISNDILQSLSQTIESTSQSHRGKSRSVSNEDSLFLLTLLAKGWKWKNIQQSHQLFSKMSAKQLHNIFRCVLLRLCKTFIEVLPKNTTTMGYEQFQNKYFKNPKMLAHYTENGLNLSEIFKNISFIKDWQKVYKQYLLQGYRHDFLPQQIVNMLDSFKDHYRNIIYIHQIGYHHIQPKLKATPKTAVQFCKRPSLFSSDCESVISYKIPLSVLLDSEDNGFDFSQ